MKSLLFILFVSFGFCNLSAQLVFTSSYTATVVSKSIAHSDFNLDGNRDFVVSDYSLNKIKVFLGTGTGNFLTPLEFSVGTTPYFVYAVDLNNDLKTDIITANSNSNNLSVLMGSGNGSFSSAVNYSVGMSPSSITAGDFNGDSKMDIACSNFTSNDVNVLFGDGSGGLTVSGNYSSGTTVNPVSICNADLNNDAKADLIVCNKFTNSFSIFLNAGSGLFASPISYGFTETPVFISSYDFNMDGKKDIITINSTSSSLNYRTIGVFTGNGDGTLQSSIDTPGPSLPLSGCIGDFDSNGHLDVVMAYGGVHSLSFSDGHTDGTFGSILISISGVTSGAEFVCSADFDNNGKPDLAYCGNGSVEVLLNNTITGNKEEKQLTNQLFNVYPNPSNGILFVNSTDVVKLSLLNEFGQHIQDAELNAGNNYKMVLDDLRDGIYFIKGIGKQGIITKKIVILKP
ncbi:MAG: T9SS type A sorting domain-containing protein [Bacteroidota bacterium]